MRLHGRVRRCNAPSLGAGTRSSNASLQAAHGAGKALSPYQMPLLRQIFVNGAALILGLGASDAPSRQL